MIRGYIGLFLQDIDENLVKALNMKRAEGVLVADVVRDEPAHRAGIKRGNVITEFHRKKVEGGSQLRNIVAMTKPKTPVKIILRTNGQKMNEYFSLIFLSNSSSFPFFT